MITIATHKKPQSQGDYWFLYTSLVEAIGRILRRPDILTEILFPAPPRGLPADTNYAVVNRTPQRLAVTRWESDYNVEIGARQGRIDSHIILDIHHRSTEGIKVDHRRIGQLVDAELEVENQRFAAADVRQGDGTLLRWANPTVYTSFRLVGQVQLRRTADYIDKSNKPNQPPLHQQDLDFYNEAVLFRNGGGGISHEGRVPVEALVE